MSASQELRRRLGKTPSPYEIAAHLREAQARESELADDRRRKQQRSREQAAVLALPEAPTEDPVIEEPVSLPPPPEDDLELSGYTVPTDDELRELMTEEAAA